MSVRGFCEATASAAHVPIEIRTGRLRVAKAGSRTIVTSDDAEDWLNCLPVIRSRLMKQPFEAQRPAPRANAEDRPISKPNAVRFDNCRSQRKLGSMRDTSELEA